MRLLKSLIAVGLTVLSLTACAFQPDRQPVDRNPYYDRGGESGGSGGRN